MVVAYWYSVDLSFISGFILLFLSWQIYRQKHIVGHNIFWKLIFLFSIITLIFGINNLGLFFPDLGPYPLSLHLYIIYFASFYFIPVLWILYCLHFTGHKEMVTWRNGILLSILSIILILLRINEFWNVIPFNNIQDIINENFTRILELGYLYLYGLLILGIILLVLQFRNVSDKGRYQIGFLVFGMLIPIVHEFFTEGNLLPSGMDVSITGFFLAFGILYCDMLIYSPVFRERFFDIIDSGLVVMNKKGEILDMNIVAEKILNISRNDAFTKKPSELSSIPHEFKEILTEPDKIGQQPHFQVSYPEQRWYTISARWISKNFSSGGVFLVDISDVTKNVILEKELTRKNIQVIREKERTNKEMQYFIAFSADLNPKILISRGEIIACNSAALELLQKKEEDLTGTDPALLSAQIQMKPDDVLEKFHYSIEDAITGNTISFPWRFSKGEDVFTGNVTLCRVLFNSKVLVEMTIQTTGD